MTRPDRSAHRLLEDRHRELDARLRRRLAEAADVLDLPSDVRTELVHACARAAHLHTADCARVDYEFRSGRGSSAEEEALREEAAEGRWEAALVMLDAAVASAREESAARSSEEADERRYRVRYQPMERVTRPYR